MEARSFKIGSQFSGIGAFDEALKRLGIEFENVYQADWDKYARHTYLLNHDAPEYYVEDVYDTPVDEITKKHGSLDIVMFSPPCQSFSMAGNRGGENDDRGVLFYNSHEFIKKNGPRFFIFENVKGLLSSKSDLTYVNSIYLLLYNFQNINKWENLNTQKNSLNLLSQSISSYLCLNFPKKLNLKKDKSGTYSNIKSELSFEKMEILVKNGLDRRSKFLEERIYQITKNSNYLQKELTVPLGCKEEDLVLNQEQSYLIENISHKVISILEKTVDINVNTSLFSKSILEENSKKGKWYTTLTELNSTIESKTFMYVIELNIIRLIILALDLSQILWKEIWLTLTLKKGFIGLKTFDVWLFNLDHLNYNVHHFVLNAKNYGIPQNRERIFIIGIRDDEDNYFRIPKPFPLEKRILDILEKDVPQKYFLSKKMLKGFISGTEKQKEKDNGFGFEIADVEGVAKAITTKPGGRKTDNFINVGHINQDTQASQVFSPEGISPTITAGSKGYANGYIKVKSGNQKGFEFAEVGDSISLSQPNSETRRGRVGKQISNTIETSPNMAVFVGTGAIRGRGEGWQQTLEMNKESISNTVTSVQKDNVLVYEDMIRKFTPREVLRLMDFGDHFKWDVSDTQIYKQGGNSIPVGLLVAILKSLLRIKE